MAKTLHKLVRLLFCVGVAVWWQAGSTTASQTLSMPELYDSVINQLFKFQHPIDRSITFVSITHADLPEIQLAYVMEGGRLEVEIWTLPSDAKPVSAQLTTMRKAQPGISAEQAASRIRIEDHSITVSPSPAIRSLLNFRPTVVPFSGIDMLTLDGALYELTIRSPSRDVTYRVWDAPNASSSDDPIVRWIGTVRDALEKVAAVSRPAGAG